MLSIRNKFLKCSKLRTENNTLKLELEELKELIGSEFLKNVMKQFKESLEIKKLKEETKMLREKNKKYKEMIKGWEQVKQTKSKS